jgi:hypothetical protein
MTMGILSKIFGDKDNLDKLTDGAVHGLDKIFFTKEEKAEANQKLSEWYLKYLAATQPQNVARRVIAFIVVGLWAILVLLGVLIKWFNDAYATYVFEVLAEIVMNPFLMIMGFYFLTHAVRAYRNGK